MLKMDYRPLLSPPCNLSYQTAGKPQTSISKHTCIMFELSLHKDREKALNLSDGICCRWQFHSLSSSHTSFLMNIWVCETFTADKPSLSLSDIISKNNNRLPENIICQRWVSVCAHADSCHQAVIFQTSTWQ